MYRLTGDEGYACRARDIVNSSVNYREVWKTGTPALDNGKIFLLIEAAELIRDFLGWAEADKEAFRRVLRDVFYEPIQDGFVRAAVKDVLKPGVNAVVVTALDAGVVLDKIGVR